MSSTQHLQMIKSLLAKAEKASSAEEKARIMQLVARASQAGQKRSHVAWRSFWAARAPAGRTGGTAKTRAEEVEKAEEVQEPQELQEARNNNKVCL